MRQLAPVRLTVLRASFFSSASSSILSAQARDTASRHLSCHDGGGRCIIHPRQLLNRALAAGSAHYSSLGSRVSYHLAHNGRSRPSMCSSRVAGWAPSCCRTLASPALAGRVRPFLLARPSGSSLADAPTAWRATCRPTARLSWPSCSGPTPSTPYRVWCASSGSRARPAAVPDAGCSAGRCPALYPVRVRRGLGWTEVCCSAFSELMPSSALLRSRCGQSLSHCARSVGTAFTTAPLADFAGHCAGAAGLCTARRHPLRR